LLSENYGYEVDIPEFTLIRQGDKLEERKKFEEARIIYEYVIEKYPHDLNSYARLAELDRKMGNYSRSIDYYEQFLARLSEPFIERRLNSLKEYINKSAAYAIEKTIMNDGIESGITVYRRLKSDDQNQLYFSENDFNSLGYNLIARKKINAAVEVFKMNVEMNPRSANAYDSLGEGYMLMKDSTHAILNYRKSLELNPENTNAKKMLEKLNKNKE
jgi:tetratricopeptide (TPR) repeat protein